MGIMPPPKIPSPQFSPTGRYVLDIRERYYTDLIGKPVFHDSENYQEECHIELIPANYMSRFDSLGWGLRRGYARCNHCLTSKISSV